jgi:hypothetical protein
MDVDAELNPSLTMDDLKQVFETATFELSCATLKRFSQMEKDVLCTTNAAFKEKCANYCAKAVAVPAFVLDATPATVDAGPPDEPFRMKNLKGSYVLRPSEQWKTIAYAHVDGLDACQKRCLDDAGCACKLATFNSKTKECTLDCPTPAALQKYAGMTDLPYVPSDAAPLESTTFEKIPNVATEPQPSASARR